MTESPKEKLLFSGGMGIRDELELADLPMAFGVSTSTPGELVLVLFKEELNEGLIDKDSMASWVSS
jgi:hypothetical protein